MFTLPVAVRSQQVLAWHEGRPCSHAQFAGHVAAVAALLPEASHVLNLCEDRYRFMLAFAAAGSRRQVSLMPSSRVPAALNALLEQHPGCYALGDGPVEGFAGRTLDLRDIRPATPAAAAATLDESAVAMVAHTSGSSGAATAHEKTWRELKVSAELSAPVLARHAGVPALAHAIIATVPPQHMYGFEFSVMLPFVSGCAAHSGRPLFFEDLAAAAAQVPEPRLLLTTPLHLRKLLEAGASPPQFALIVSATAPLARDEALEIERRFGAPLCEVYGCTEAGAIATRRTARDEPWRLHPGMRLEQGAEGFLVSGPQLPAPVPLADSLEPIDDTRFRLLGRHSDMLKVAGKRASLADLTRQLMNIPGVRDAVVFVPDPDRDEARPAALVEAPGLEAREILAALSAAVDPVFLPRPLRKVDALPRDSLGKLKREALLELLRRG
ncbi:MAG: AMP-binding protein [Gammaproteobacteria bacterium]